MGLLVKLGHKGLCGGFADPHIAEALTRYLLAAFHLLGGQRALAGLFLLFYSLGYHLVILSGHLIGEHADIDEADEDERQDAVSHLQS